MNQKLSNLEVALMEIEANGGENIFKDAEYARKLQSSAKFLQVSPFQLLRTYPKGVSQK